MKSLQAHMDASPDCGFSKEDVLAAGRELGISEAALETAFREHLTSSRNRAAGTLAEKPFPSRLHLCVTKNSFDLQVPAAGVRASHAPALVFAAFWMAFLALWTGAAVTQSSAVLAALSTPFWLAGATLVANTFQHAGQRMRLTLNTTGRGALTRRFGPSIPLELADLQVKPQPGTERSATSPPVGAHVALEHGGRSYRLLEGWSEAERDWIATELQRWLHRR